MDLCEMVDDDLWLADQARLIADCGADRGDVALAELGVACLA